MAFESDHGLYVDGVAGPSDWAALLRAVAAREVTARPYTYLIATADAARDALCVAGRADRLPDAGQHRGYKATTPLGTWPVYLRFLSVTMKGTNPDGTKYDDPGVPWVSYFYESDAVHGFLRAAGTATPRATAASNCRTRAPGPSTRSTPTERSSP